MLQLTGVVDERSMRAQYLDRMDIERERGITIKAQNVRLPWSVADEKFVLHLIDTPGHVDFTYEVSRALEACEGAVLLVDAAQGIEAQTLANLYLALDRDLAIIPVLNKSTCRPPTRTATPARSPTSSDVNPVMCCGLGKTGEGVAELLDHVVREVPAPTGDPDAPTRAMIFDSVYDIYRGVVTYVRVIDGKILSRERIKMMSTGATHELLEVGIVSPESKPTGTGRRRGRVPDHGRKGRPPIQGRRHRHHRPPRGHPGADRLPRAQADGVLRAVSGRRLRLSQPARRAGAAAAQRRRAVVGARDVGRAGFRFPLRFLGLLHMEITRERLEREFDLDLISTSPNVVYRVVLEGKPGAAGTRSSSRTLRTGRKARSAPSTSPSSRPRSSRRANSSERSWSCASPVAANWAAWTICRPSGWSCVTQCRWGRSSLTSSTR